MYMLPKKKPYTLYHPQLLTDLYIENRTLFRLNRITQRLTGETFDYSLLTTTGYYAQ